MTAAIYSAGVTRCPTCGLMGQWNTTQSVFTAVGVCKNCGTVVSVLRQDPTYIVTVKLPRNPNHDPRNKQTARCKFSPICTDSTGEHHNFLVMAPSVKKVREIVKKVYGDIHITRIEKGEYVD